MEDLTTDHWLPKRIVLYISFIFFFTDHVLTIQFDCHSNHKWIYLPCAPEPFPTMQCNPHVLNKFAYVLGRNSLIALILTAFEAHNIVNM
jgi:hypothetical protein